MTTKRWMKSVLKASQDCKVAMPWARGPRRASTIARLARLTGATRHAHI